jgi:uncharacterized protein YbaR (Trm112 family)
MKLVNKELMEILVCPVDKEKVVEMPEAAKLRCVECGRLYPVRDGIPVMLVDEAETPASTLKPSSET